MREVARKGHFLQRRQALQGEPAWSLAAYVCPRWLTPGSTGAICGAIAS